MQTQINVNTEQGRHREIQNRTRETQRNTNTEQGRHRKIQNRTRQTQKKTEKERGRHKEKYGVRQTKKDMYRGKQTVIKSNAEE